ncbi:MULTISPECIES: aspartyl-phosphate phosphatase Spo0E family protein [unclassified Bacillus (in: firmicutes)]|jgi:stage 0 sporulation regulatory protein|uniref:aspartyl-phosphate phosphatase Spo0E family protein n=1 Tax=unclassified Bacillus (in: firmicutes) TaxID=185979 RepID=UPI00193FE2C8|nr:MULTISPECIES: aspartyl-phosphate phosphatase Spo0E family protein [unclassified Bacillus (in: firmicutes)]MBM4764392.1 Spo0E family sporulation regulatory protein-aspartic acid phosphatase [Bacillus sp. B15-48]MCQ6275770.1 aspartyl-phosphate phosphatase Spo0E family protein [Bacillus sp. V3B]
MKTKVLSLKELEDKIDVLRTCMIDLATSNGFTHPDTIKCSQELDVLLNEHQKIKSKLPIIL